MARSHLYRPIQDAEGNLRRSAVVRVFDANGAGLTTVPLYAGPVGTAVKGAVHTAANGIIDFYTDTPQRFRIGIQANDEPEVIFDAVDVLEPSLPLDSVLGVGSQANVVVSRVVTESTTLGPEDHYVFLNGASLSCVLPSPTERTGRIYVIKNINASLAVVSTPTGLIDGDASRTLALYDVLTVVSDGTNWSVV